MGANTYVLSAKLALSGHEQRWCDHLFAESGKANGCVQVGGQMDVLIGRYSERLVRKHVFA